MTSKTKSEKMVAVKCIGCEKRYLKENAIVPSETVADGEVIDPDDSLERCPFCGTPTESSARIPVRADFDDKTDDTSPDHSRNQR